MQMREGVGSQNLTSERLHKLLWAHFQHELDHKAMLVQHKLFMYKEILNTIGFIAHEFFFPPFVPVVLPS